MYQEEVFADLERRVTQLEEMLDEFMDKLRRVEKGEEINQAAGAAYNSLHGGE